MDSGQEKAPVRVTIFQQTYTLRASGDGHDVQELADTVDQLMSAISSRTGNPDSVRVAVLACLHLADKVRSLERELDSFKSFKQRVDRRSEQFRLLLDQALEPDRK